MHGNYGAVPVGHSVHPWEDYDWIIWIDLKMVNFLLGKQKVFTKFLCHFYTWDYRARDRHWAQKDWPVHETLETGMPNITHDLIVNRVRIIFPPLHIRLGLR